MGAGYLDQLCPHLQPLRIRQMREAIPAHLHQNILVWMHDKQRRPSGFLTGRRSRLGGIAPSPAAPPAAATLSRRQALAGRP
jgi:hypothetical protein